MVSQTGISRRFLPSSLPADAFGTPKRLRPNTYLLPVFHNVSDGTAFVQQLSCRYRHIQDDTPYVLVHGMYLCPPAAAFRFYLLKADTKEFPYISNCIVLFLSLSC